MTTFKSYIILCMLCFLFVRDAGAQNPIIRDQFIADPSTRVFNAVNIRARSKTGGMIQVWLDKPDGPVIARVKIPKSNEWRIISAPLSGFRPGKHNLIVQMENDGEVEIDWVRFK